MATISLRITEKDEIMLTEITKYYNQLPETSLKKWTKSDMIRYLIFQEYEEIYKEVKKM